MAPSCKYQLGGSVFPVAGPLPCSSGQSWTFVSGSNPTADRQVACNVPGNTSLAPTFSDTTKTCSSSTSTVSLTVRPLGNSCATLLSLGAFVECSAVSPSCQYQLGGVDYPVTGPLPCSNGLTWNFVAGTTISVDGQVACSVSSNTSLAPAFSESSKACNSNTSTVNVTVSPVGNSCKTQLDLGAFTGM